MSNQVIPERLAQLDRIDLDSGSHHNFDNGHCAMEVVAWLAGLGHTDAPDCASKVLRAFTLSINDEWPKEKRQELKPFLPRMVGTGDDGKDEQRSYIALDWLIRTFTPAWLDLAGLTEEAQELRDLRRIVDMVAAEAAGPVVRKAEQKASAAWSAARSAAWSAAGSAAESAAESAAGSAAWSAAGSAAWSAAGSAAWSAAGSAAESAAESAAWSAAGSAAAQVLKPTVDLLQASALELLDAMIDPQS